MTSEDNGKYHKSVHAVVTEHLRGRMLDPGLEMYQVLSHYRQSRRLPDGAGIARLGENKWKENVFTLDRMDLAIIDPAPDFKAETIDKERHDNLGLLTGFGGPASGTYQIIDHFAGAGCCKINMERSIRSGKERLQMYGNEASGAIYKLYQEVDEKNLGDVGVHKI